MNKAMKQDKAERIFEVMGEIDENIIYEADTAQLKAKPARNYWIKRISATVAAGAAACLCIIIAAGLMFNRGVTPPDVGINGVHQATVQNFAEIFIQEVKDNFNREARAFAEHFVAHFNEHGVPLREDWWGYVDSVFAFHERGESSSIIVDTRIDSLEIWFETNDMLPYPVEVWHLHFPLQVEYPMPIPFIWDGRFEDGWITLHMYNNIFMVIAHEDSGLLSIGQIPSWVMQNTPNHTPWGREMALRMFLENQGILPAVTFPGNHYVANFDSGIGGWSHPARMLLSQPFGEGGIWVVERWADSLGNYIHYALPTNGNFEQTSIEYYAELQRQFELGSIWLGDPAEVARRYLLYVHGWDETFAPISAVFAIPYGADPFSEQFNTAPPPTNVEPILEDAVRGLLMALYPYEGVYGRPFSHEQLLRFASVAQDWDWQPHGIVESQLPYLHTLFDVAFNGRYTYSDLDPQAIINALTMPQSWVVDLALQSSQENTYTFRFQMTPQSLIGSTRGLVEVTTISTEGNATLITISEINIIRGPHITTDPTPEPTSPPTPEPTPWPVNTETPFVPPTVEISEFGRQVTHDFITQFPTLFSFHYRFEDGSFGQNIAGNLAYSFYPPLVSYSRTYGLVFFDRHGNEIEDAAFIIGEGLFDRGVAFHASMYYLGNNGIPDIVITWGVPDTGATRREMFRFIDGEFRSMGILNAPCNFFYTPDGRVIVLYDSEYNSVHGYYYITFLNNVIAHELIIAPNMYTWESGESWRNHHMWPYFFENPNPTMYGTNQPLTQIFPLTELQGELAADIIEQLLTE